MTVKYTESGLWLEELADGYRIGLSEKGQDDVGEVMFVDLPDFGDTLQKGDNLLSVEGAKAVTEILIPMSGSVKKVHTEIADDLSLINSTSRDENWILEITDVSNLDENELSNNAWFD